MSSLPAIWSGSEEVSIPNKSVTDIGAMMSYAQGLSPRLQSKIVGAFNDLGAYDMAVDFAWGKTISRLKETLASLGMQFIGEMMGRSDITDSTPYESVITEIQTIQLAEQLGLLTGTAALHLRHAQELISHHLSDKADEELDKLQALNIIKDSIKYVLGHENMVVAMEFAEFRNSLLTESFQEDDTEIELLLGAPIFYAKTVCFVLLNSIKKDTGAKIEHALANFNIILPLIWEKLGETERWNVGLAYRDVVADNNVTASNGLKHVLLKVGGFDYVPESLRSNTFIKAAQNLIAVHYARDNFYNEPAAVKSLANLGSTIPKPAFLFCIQAYLIVYLGNAYGVSHAAVPVAKDKLSEIPEDRWLYYFEKGLNNDKEVLYHLVRTQQVERMSNLLYEFGLTDFSDLPKNNQRLYNNIINRKYSYAANLAGELYTNLISNK